MANEDAVAVLILFEDLRQFLLEKLGGSRDVSNGLDLLSTKEGEPLCPPYRVPVICQVEGVLFLGPNLQTQAFHGEFIFGIGVVSPIPTCGQEILVAPFRTEIVGPVEALKQFVLPVTVAIG
jgi:hypothetical protein